jgi:hypothetical protein
MRTFSKHGTYKKFENKRWLFKVCSMDPLVQPENFLQDKVAIEFSMKNKGVGLLAKATRNMYGQNPWWWTQGRSCWLTQEQLGFRSASSYFEDSGDTEPLMKFKINPSKVVPSFVTKVEVMGMSWQTDTSQYRPAVSFRPVASIMD